MNHLNSLVVFLVGVGIVCHGSLTNANSLAVTVGVQTINYGNAVMLRGDWKYYGQS